MSSLKAFEDATHWRPASLRPVRTSEADVTAGLPAASAGLPASPGPPSASTPANITTPQYRTPNFMMYGFKVALCSHAGRHQWSECPFAHPTENARRRDPRVFSYSCHECPSYRNTGYCPKGDNCEYSHGIFEARLHPDSYRTVKCKDGSNCHRKICFFYHNDDERRTPTGLHEARAQITAELVANSLLTSSPSISNTIQELNTSLSQPLCPSQTLRSMRSHGPLASPLASTRSPCANLSTAFSGLSVSTGNSGVLLGQDTVAPCMKGANRNKARIRELAHEVGLHPDVLMNALRTSALQGEMTPQSIALAMPRGTFPARVEAMLEDLADSEELPLDKLRGLLQRQLSPRSPSPVSPGRPLSPMVQFSTPRQRSPCTSGNSNCSAATMQPSWTSGGHEITSPPRHTPLGPRTPGPFMPREESVRAIGGNVPDAGRWPVRSVSWMNETRRSASDAISWRSPAVPNAARSTPR